MITISDDDLVQVPIINRPSWKDTVNEIHGVYPQRILTAPGIYQFNVTGLNTNGELGFNDYVDRLVFTEHDPVLTNVNAVEGGSHFSMILKSDGTIWAAGWNFYGQLGIGVFPIASPFDILVYTQEVLEDTDWAEISCGWNHTLAIKTDGTLWSTGRNHKGQLGLGSGDRTNRHTFEQVDSSIWIDVVGSNYNSMGIKSDGTLWTWGDNLHGQLGQGHIINPYDGQCIPEQVGIDTDWVQVTSGDQSCFALKSDGTLWSAGENNEGKLGVGDQIDKDEFTQVHDTDGVTGGVWDSVNIVDDATMAIRIDGTLWSTGHNFYGQCGLGDTNDRDEFNKVGTDTDWEKIKAGSSFFIIRKSNGVLYGTGLDHGGNFGADFSGPPFNGSLTTPQIIGDGALFTNIFSCTHEATLGNKTE